MSPSFAEFTADLTFADLPPPVLQVLRRSFADIIGVAAIASQSEMARIACNAATALYGVGTAGGAAMLMHGGRVSPVGAAMAGAFTIDAVDAHDSTSPCKGHAGSAVFPAMLALAQVHPQPVTGAEFALWLALGYEVSCRAGLAQHATCPDYHTSGSWTATGIAAVTARILGGDAQIIRHAAGIGEYHGPRSQMMRCIDHPTMVRDGVGWGAPSGVAAGYMAVAGFTGAPALTCEAAPDHWADLGTAWRTVEDTSYKPYPCCRWAHPAIDAAKDLMAQHNLHHSQIDRVTINTFHMATRLAGQTPADDSEFAYSIAFPVACMIVRGQIGVPELAPETLSDPDILRISTATDLVDDPHLTEISQGKRWAQVDLHLKDGRTLTSPPRTPRGDADDPLSETELSEKFHLFAGPVLGDDRARQIESLCLRFDTLDAQDFSRLITLCVTAP